MKANHELSNLSIGSTNVILFPSIRTHRFECMKISFTKQFHDFSISICVYAHFLICGRYFAIFSIPFSC